MPKKRKRVADKETVFAVIDDAVATLLIRDREDDEDLPIGEIERLVEAGDLSIDEMVDRFRESLEEHLEDLESPRNTNEDEDSDGDLDEDFEGEEDDD